MTHVNQEMKPRPVTAFQEHPPTPGAVFHGTRHNEQKDDDDMVMPNKSLSHVIAHLWNVYHLLPCYIMHMYS